jgi:L-serine dehydratase
MDISIFKVTGPVMIGPSSSHTAGAARLSRAARRIAGGAFDHVSFGLHGSFAKTAGGHGTDRALVAGAIGLFEDDERIADAFSLARAAGIGWDFYETDLGEVHSNSVKMTFSMADGGSQEVVGSSIGGGRIAIVRINGFETELSAQSNTLVISQYDRRGVVSDITRVLAQNGINIGVMKLSRKKKGDRAFCVIETDDCIPKQVVKRIRALDNIIAAQVLHMDEREDDGCTTI